MIRRFFKLSSALSLSIVCALLISAGLQLPSQAKPSELKASTSDQLLNCMSVPGSSLNVLYLIDISQSWGDTDRDKNRAPMISSTLSMFAQLGQEIRKEVKFSFVQFGTESDSRVVQDWQKVTARSAPGQAANVQRWTSQNSSAGTNWEAGLRVAIRQIQNARVANPRSCFAMVWLTDGTLDLSGARHTGADLVKEFDSMNRICSSSAGVPYFRDPQNNVTLIGALVNSNQGPPPPYPGGPEVFKLLVSGNGNAVTIGTNKKFDCPLMPGQIPGNFLSRSTVTELRWQFLDLIATLSGLQRADSDVSPAVGRHVAKVQIYIKEYKPGQSLQVIDENNIDLCAPSQNLCRFGRSGNSATYWTIDVPSSGPGSVTSPEEWTIKVTPQTDTKVFVGIRGANKSLSIKASDGLNFLNIGEGTSIKGNLSIVDESNGLINQNDFENINFCVDSPNSLRSAGCSTGPSLPIDYPAASSDKLFRVHADVKLPGVAKPFRIAFSSPIKVLQSNAFPRLGCDKTQSWNGVEYCELNPIPNRFKKSSNTLIAKILQGTGSVKVVGFQADDVGSRASEYDFDSEDDFIKVLAGSESKVGLEISNPQAKSLVDQVFGAVSYESKAVLNGTEVVVVLQVPVVFKINQDANWIKLFLLYLAALLGGIGLPYLVLLMMARKRAVFITGDYPAFRYITVPVKISSAGQLQSPVAEVDNADEDEHLFSKPVTVYTKFAAPDWRSLSQEVSIPEKARTLNVDGATLTVTPIKWDAFRPVGVTLTAPGSLVFSNEGESAWVLSKEQSTADLNINGLIFFRGSLDQIQPIVESSYQESEDPFNDLGSHTVQKVVANNGDLEGVLTLVLVGYPNARSVIEGLTSLLVSRNFHDVVTKLRSLREENLKAESAENHAKSSGDTRKPDELEDPDDPFAQN